jgi:hypothetical protein
MARPGQHGHTERGLAAILTADAAISCCSRLMGAEWQRPPAGVRGIRWQ